MIEEIREVKHRNASKIAAERIEQLDQCPSIHKFLELSLLLDISIAMDKRMFKKIFLEWAPVAPADTINL